jgi:release factor glutamine methyltransferase
MSQSPASSGEQKGSAEPWTILRLLHWTTDFFRQKGSESPRLDSEVLLAHVLGCSRVELYTSFASVPNDDQRVAFREMVRRRGEGMPVALLVGYREFYSLRFRVTEDTLIPRPETEHLVVEALDCAASFPSFKRPLQIADIGTGSGVIAITLAKHLPEARITATDRCIKALAIASWNAQQLGVAERVRLLESDLLGSVDQPRQFDMICSNPPYVSVAEYRELSPSIRKYEPVDALVAGSHGSEVIARIIHEVPDRLCTGGRLIMELSPMIADACAKLAMNSGHFDDLRFLKDLGGDQRILSIRRN